MSFLRLGTRIAVINHRGEILLSKRGDFGTWELPGGRVDSREMIQDSAAREALEETGLDVTIERPIGLYFQQGRNRLNVLYRAKPSGGHLVEATDETTANKFYSRERLPDNIFGRYMVHHAYAYNTYLHVANSSQAKLFEIQMRLGMRWLQNYFAGHPEPTFPRFKVSAAAILWDETQRHVFTIRRESLPRYVIDGSTPLHHVLTNALAPFCTDILHWQWVGLFQNPMADEIEFVFAAVGEPHPNFISQWVLPEEMNAISGRDIAYLKKERDRQSPDVWLIQV